MRNNFCVTQSKLKLSLPPESKQLFLYIGAMLTISNEKIKTLNKEIRQPDRKELENELAEFFPTLPKDELDNFIDAGLEKTARYKIDEETAVTDFIRLMIDIARDFDEHPKAKAQLTRRDIKPNLRVQLLSELITPVEWREAESFGPRASIWNK